MRPLIPLAAALLAACAGAAPEPATEAPEAARADLAALPNAIEEDGIEVAFVDGVPEDKARLILAEALRARAAIDEFFGTSLGVVPIRISDERRIPTASRGTIYLPADRVDQVTADWASDPLSITHEMTHLLGSGRRPDRMLVEGLAVYVNDRVGRPSYPNDGEDLHVATLRMQAELGRTIPLLESERYRKGGSREERRLAYTQEGSFARYHIERHGLQAFLDLALDDAAYADQPELWQRLEAEWRGALAAIGEDRSPWDQQDCPQPAERADRSVKWFLAHPYVADPPYAGEAGLPENYRDMLAPYRERIDLVGLTWEEVERLTERDAAACRSLEDWLFSQPGIGPEARYGFYRARDRYVVAVWRQLEPGRMRLGRYQDTFVAVLDQDLSLIEKVH